MPRPLILLLALAAACQPPVQEPSALTEADLAAIRTSTENFGPLLVAANYDAVAALYTEDAVFMPPGAPSVTGREAIRGVMATFPPILEARLVSDEIEGTGDLLYSRGRYVMTMEGMPADSGKYIEIHRRGADGTWRIAVDIFNSSVPPQQ